MASSSIRRCPTITTPRSSAVRLGRTFSLISFSRNAASYRIVRVIRRLVHKVPGWSGVRVTENVKSQGVNSGRKCRATAGLLGECA
jgi:hypothetical protein